MSVPAAFYNNAVDLNRFSNGVARQIIISYNNVILDAVAQLQGLDEMQAPMRATRLRAILADLKQSLDGWRGDAVKLTGRELQGLAVLQSEFVEDQLRQALPIEARRQVRSVQVSPGFAQAVATTDPTAINVVALSDDLQIAVAGAPQATFQLTAAQGATITLPNGKVIEKAFRGMAADNAELFANTVRNGLFEGKSITRISRELRGRLRFGQPGSARQIALAGGEVTKMANHQVLTLVRTSVNQVSNAASMASYKANQEVTKKYRYVATLDNRTSAICRAHDGKEFVYGKGPQPPQHFNCRSTTVPVIDYAGLGIDPPPPGKRSSDDGLVPQDQTYGEWLSKQPQKKKAEILGGERRAQIFDKFAAKVGPKEAIRRFVREDGSELTLRDLENKLKRTKVKPASTIDEAVAKKAQQAAAKKAAAAKAKAAAQAKAEAEAKAKKEELAKKLAASKAKTAAAKKAAEEAKQKLDATKAKLNLADQIKAKQKEYNQLNADLLTAPTKETKALVAKTKAVKAELDALKAKDPSYAAIEKAKAELKAKEDALIAKTLDSFGIVDRPPVPKALKAAKPPAQALEDYTGEEYKAIRTEQFRAAKKQGKKLNSYQERWLDDYPPNRGHASSAKKIESFLERAPKYKGSAYRTVATDQEGVDQLLAQLKGGEETLAMESWTKNKDLEFAGKGRQQVLMRTTSKRGVDISTLSIHYEEDEVLMPSGVRYRLKGVEKVEIDAASTKKGLFRWIIDVEQL